VKIYFALIRQLVDAHARTEASSADPSARHEMVKAHSRLDDGGELAGVKIAGAFV
jgi:hypothetical protein